jgi:hypothetical protein
LLFLIVKEENIWKLWMFTVKSMTFKNYEMMTSL